MVKALKFYKCDPKMIDVIVDLYMGDRTEKWGGTGGDRGYEWN